MPHSEVNSTDDVDEYGGLQPLSIIWALIAGLAFGGCYIVLAGVGMKVKGLLSAAAVGTIILIARTYWNFRKTSWFPVCMVAAIAIHALLICLIDVQKPAFPVIVIVFPLLCLDFAVTLIAFWLVKSRF